MTAHDLGVIDMVLLHTEKIRQEMYTGWSIFREHISHQYRLNFEH
jgi:hypothetical protein